MLNPMKQNNRPQWTDLSANVGHKKTADGIEASSYYFKRYFSVLDAEIYFGNQFVEDVAHIDWQVQQNNMPLFGYNSYTYDEMARGNRIIAGSFDINFTTPKYLYQILQAAGKELDNSITNMKSYNVPTLDGKETPAINKSLYGETTGSKHYPKWPDTFDIDIIFGQKTAVGNPVHIVLEGVVLGSCQMILDGAAAGTPPNVMERYTFYARDIKTSADGVEG